ncbi:MAG TPA: SAM-dependent methyltransferase [Bryobacterales bacterium]|nr:SAM-dependent methyltransferase [Bryobacterales bacterium]
MNELERQIREEIAASGPLPFTRFMELALYHPTLGYYRRTRDPFGVAGDYYTNAQLQPVFGRLIAQKIAACHEALGRPRDFTVVELGAGRGETAREIRACLPQIGYLEIERDRGVLPDRFVGVVVANEFFDALPVHVVRSTGAEILERFVAVDREKLGWTDGTPSTALLEGYVRRFAPSLAAGQIVEVNLHALEWMERIACSLERGYVLVIDYGYTSREIAGGRRFPEGSLMSYRRHTAYADVLAEPGERDITAHVNFTALAGHAAPLGLRAAPLETQAQFLLSIGQADEFRSALAASSERDTARRRMLLKTLLFGLGETFQVQTFQRVEEKG